MPDQQQSGSSKQTQQQQQQQVHHQPGEPDDEDGTDAADADGDPDAVDGGVAADAAAAPTAAVSQSVSRSKKHLLQTFVFSATLTLPQSMHKRLRKGGGGSSGAATLDNLMNRCAHSMHISCLWLAPKA